jgi:hypothetical protein
MRELNFDLRTHSSEPTLIFEDNQSAICMGKIPQFHGYQHKFHFICEQVSTNKIELKYCPTEDMLADLLIKGNQS